MAPLSIHKQSQAVSQKSLPNRSRKSSKRFKRIAKVLVVEVLYLFRDLFSSSVFKKTLVVVILSALGFACFSMKKVIMDYIASTIIVSEGEILRRIKEHTSVPDETPQSIVRVEDAESLRVQHIFYRDVKEGDYIVVFKNKVIIYDLREDKIVGEKNGKI